MQRALRKRVKSFHFQTITETLKIHFLCGKFEKTFLIHQGTIVNQNIENLTFFRIFLFSQNEFGFLIGLRKDISF